MRPPGVVMGGVYGKYLAQVLLAEDQHPIGDLGVDGRHEAFGEAVRPRTPRRDLHHRDARVRHHRVERRRDVTGPIADEEPESGDTFADVHDEVAGLLGGPGPVGMRVALAVPVVLGHLPSIDEAAALVQVSEVIHPDPNTAEFYRRLRPGFAATAEAIEQAQLWRLAQTPTDQCGKRAAEDR